MGERRAQQAGGGEAQGRGRKQGGRESGRTHPSQASRRFSARSASSARCLTCCALSRLQRQCRGDLISVKGHTCQPAKRHGAPHVRIQGLVLGYPPGGVLAQHLFDRQHGVGALQVRSRRSQDIHLITTEC